MSVAEASGFSCLTFSRLLLQYSKYPDGGRLSSSLAFLPLPLAFFSERARFSPDLSASDFLPLSAGSCRKATSASTFSAFVPDVGWSHSASSVLIILPSSLDTEAFFFSSSAPSRVKPENSRRFFFTSVCLPGRPKHTAWNFLSSSLDAGCLSMRILTFSMSPSFVPAPAAMVNSFTSFSSILKVSTAFTSRFGRSRAPVATGSFAAASAISSAVAPKLTKMIKSLSQSLRLG